MKKYSRKVLMFVTNIFFYEKKRLKSFGDFSLYLDLKEYTAWSYFFKKQENLTPSIANIEDFQYPGPKPFSKETAILMMADSVEAASKSLKAPSVSELQSFINKIIDGKMSEHQFNSSDITFAEIETVKKVLFKKLINVYQLRVEYPE